jgi:hypothetical protein
MATHTEVRTVDDLDGSSPAETVTFAFDGKNLEIDLSKENLIRFEEAIDPFVTAARKASGPSHGRRGRQAQVTSNRPVGGGKRAGARAWARENGWPELSNRGALPREVRAAYDEAHPS